MRSFEQLQDRLVKAPAWSLQELFVAIDGKTDANDQDDWDKLLAEIENVQVFKDAPLQKYVADGLTGATGKVSRKH